MCLDLRTQSRKAEENRVKKFIENATRRHNKVRVWKVFNVVYNCKNRMILCSPMQVQEFRSHGRYLSSRNNEMNPSQIDGYELLYKDVSLGFHTFTNIKNAERYKVGQNEVVVPVWVHVNDIIAIGKDNQLVCLNFTIYKRDFERAIKRY